MSLILVALAVTSCQMLTNIPPERVYFISYLMYIVILVPSVTVTLYEIFANRISYEGLTLRMKGKVRTKKTGLAPFV